MSQRLDTGPQLRRPHSNRAGINQPSTTRVEFISAKDRMLDIEDPNLPDDLQGHTKRFSNPGKMAIVIGDDE